MKHNVEKISWEEYKEYCKSSPREEDKEDYNYFKCLNCDAVFENENYTKVRNKNYYGFNNNRGFEDLTCEEVVIKNIIE